MKKISLMLVVVGFFLGGCGSKNNNETKASSAETASSVVSTISSSTSDSKSASTETSTESSTEAVNTMTETASSQMNVAPAESSTPPVNPLSGYSDLQIEYARVWLAVMGTHYKNDLANADFELHVSHSPAGDAVNPYDENSLTFPNETETLSGKYGYQSLIVYSSNHNGSITTYPVPSHFQYPNVTAEDKAFLKKQEQEILSKATVVGIPTGNPDDVKELISVMKIDN